MKSRIVLLFLFSFYFATGQIGGNAVYKFLNLASSAKQSALGGKVYTGLKSDIFQPIYNPATIDSTMVGRLGASYVNYLSDINYGNIAYARRLKKIGTVYAAVSYVNYGSFQYATANGDRQGTFGASESALILGYAYQIPKSKWHIGANAKFVLSNLEKFNSTGVAFDAGLLYKDEPNGLQTALVMRNLGTQITTYQGTKEPLPFELDLTFSKRFLHAPFKWLVTFENLQKPKIAFVNTAHSTQDPNGATIDENIGTIDHIFRHLVLGIELFPKKRFNLRAGYNFRRAAELNIKGQRFGSGFNFGFGLKLRKFEINYAYGNYSFASNANYFSVIINLNEF